MKKITQLLLSALVTAALTACSSSTTDAIDEAVADLEKLGFTRIYAANGTTQDITVHLDGTGVDTPDNETVSQSGSILLLSQFDTPNKYDLSYTAAGAVKGKTEVTKNSHLLYGATECGTNTEFFKHELSDNNNVYIMNFTDLSVDNNISIKQNGVVITLPSVAPCATTAFNISSSAGNWSVDINGTPVILESDFSNPAVENDFLVFAIYNVGTGEEAAAQTFILE